MTDLPAIVEQFPHGEPGFEQTLTDEFTSELSGVPEEHPQIPAGQIEWAATFASHFDAYQPLIEPLVQRCVRKGYVAANNLYDQEDLRSEGVLGLLQAVTAYNSASEVPFERFGRFRIYRAMIRQLRASTGLTGIPDVHHDVRLDLSAKDPLDDQAETDERTIEKHGVNPRGASWECAKYYIGDVSDDPTAESIRHTTFSSVESYIRYLRGLDRPTTTKRLAHHATSPRLDVVGDAVAYPTTESIIRDALEKVSEIEAAVIRFRFGISDPHGRGKTYEDTAIALGLTRTEVRNHENRALSRLRHPDMHDDRFRNLF